MSICSLARKSLTVTTIECFEVLNWLKTTSLTNKMKLTIFNTLYGP